MRACDRCGKKDRVIRRIEIPDDFPMDLARNWFKPFRPSSHGGKVARLCKECKREIKNDYVNWKINSTSKS